MSPDFRSATSSGFMSKVTTLAELAASFTDWTAVRAIGAPSVSTASMLLSVWSGHGDNDTVDLLVDGRLDELRLLGGRAVAGVEELDIVLVGRHLRPLADGVPESVTGGGVGDHGELVARVGDRGRRRRVSLA